MRLNRVKIINEAGEEPEEGLLLERRALFLVKIGKNEHEDRKNFGQIVNFGLIVVDARSIAVILDDVHDEPGHRIKSLESVFEISSCYTLNVAVDARLRAHSEEERRHVFDLENTLLGQLSDEGNKVLLEGVRALIDINPLLKPNKQLFLQLFGLR